MKDEDSNQGSPLTVTKFEKFTEELRALSAKALDPNVQASICRKLIEKVEVSTQGITIHYHVGDHHYEIEFDQTEDLSLIGKDAKGESSSRGLVEKSARPFFISRPLGKYRIQKSFAEGTTCQTVDGSNSLTSGRG